ncbi:DNA gyrase subunit A [Candidatus Saccharibacteria bacterium]|nr:DNA gyrase subunit A [Candidatus Saccharibacteria bacterium]
MNDEQEKTVKNLGIETQTVENVMEDNFLRYSMSVIIDRALPDVRDGLKPVHRRILYAMEKRGWKAPNKTVKSANIVGEVMAKYHPHGDSSIYDAMVRLAQPWSMRYTLVEGQGNFGSMDGDEAAAYRYTEARMDKLGATLLTDIDKETVDFRDNYEGTEQEPTVLPAAVPNLLLNGQMGIAVGMATNMPPHNLNEVIDATIAQIDNPEITLEELLKFIKGPDFPTGAEVYGGAPMKQAYKTGKGSVVIRAVTHIEETKKGRFNIIVDEVPYGMSKEAFIQRLSELALAKKINHIAGAHDESARGKIRVVIELKKDAYPKKVLNQLYKMTGLQTSFHYNMLALVDGIQPRILGLKDILAEFIKHRRNVVYRRTEFELRQAKARAHILEGLKIALDHIDEVIKTIRASKSAEEAKVNLMKKFGLSELQALAILAMQLRKLTGLEREAIENELAELIKLMAELESILADEGKLFGVIKTELLEIKERFGDKRRSKMFRHEVDKMDDEDLIPEEESVVVLTGDNYIKRTSLSDYKKQNRGGKGKRGMTTKENDVIQQLLTINSHDYLVFFTNFGRIFRIKAFEVPVASLASKGTAAVNLLQTKPDEKITSIIKQERDAAPEGYLFMTTLKGTVKKTAVKEFENIRMSGLIGIKLEDGDELRWVKHTSGKDDVIISTSAGNAIRFNEADVRPMGRVASGVRGAKIRPLDRIVGMDTVIGNDQKLMVISQNGFGKLTKVSNFPTHRRGGLGIRAASVDSKTGPIVEVRSVPEDVGEVIIISSGGQVVRTELSGISTLGRDTKGVRVMRLDESDAVVSVGFVPKESPTDQDDVKEGEVMGMGGED